MKRAASTLHNHRPTTSPLTTQKARPHNLFRLLLLLFLHWRTLGVVLFYFYLLLDLRLYFTCVHIALAHNAGPFRDSRLMNDDLDGWGGWFFACFSALLFFSWSSMTQVGMEDGWMGGIGV